MALNVVLGFFKQSPMILSSTLFSLAASFFRIFQIVAQVKPIAKTKSCRLELFTV